MTFRLYTLRDGYISTRSRKSSIEIEDSAFTSIRSSWIEDVLEGLASGGELGDYS